jgi:MarR family transcriptional regulator, organic hydroperoxide resistance regulator
MDIPQPNSLYQAFHQVVRIHFHKLHVMLEPLGVYPGQPPLLFALAHGDGQSQKELAQRMRIQPATVTVMLRRMEASGLIERRKDTKDQRVVRVYLTEQGKDVCRKAKEIMEKLDTQLFGNFEEEEKELLKGLMLRVRDNLLNPCETEKQEETVKGNGEDGA